MYVVVCCHFLSKRSPGVPVEEMSHPWWKSCACSTSSRVWTTTSVVSCCELASVHCTPLALSSVGPDALFSARRRRPSPSRSFVRASSRRRRLLVRARQDLFLSWTFYLDCHMSVTVRSSYYLCPLYQPPGTVPSCLILQVSRCSSSVSPMRIPRARIIPLFSFLLCSLSLPLLFVSIFLVFVPLR